MSSSTFTDYAISDPIIKAIDALEYNQPTPVQARVIPKVLEDKDVIVTSQTGSGKTASFAIPLCEKVDWLENKPQVLVLTPTRELAAQVSDEMKSIGRYKRVNSVAIYGRQSFMKQKTMLKQKTHIVVGTPGRVLDHIEKGTLSVECLKYVVLDEADEMLNMGFIDQVSAILDKLPTSRTTMLFSATFPADIEGLAKKYMINPERIQIETVGKAPQLITHHVMEVEEGSKLSLLSDVTVAENPDSCIIFCRTQERVKEVFQYLDERDYSADLLHGAMVQEDRFEVMDDFKRGEFRYLVATDVAARGIDVEDITLVINFDFPLEKEKYVHRTGRTGRAGKSGKAITFMTSYEQKFLEEIREYSQADIQLSNPPSVEEVKANRTAFQEKMEAPVVLREEKREKVNQDIMKLYFNGGKKKKIRAVDFVGTIAKLPGMSAQDIGIITIQDNHSYVEILNGKGPSVLKGLKNKSIKGKKLKVHEAKK
ncbi:DEAD/DEAH box helicase [Priestia flexa]|uniref:DEAD/DEAH box helicase n=1 Tax=Priestia flexa TaxID=86664 RepID=UPI000C230AE2|nr:DEAD/DEAH box helicase [Priestia flexa]MCG7313626.1 DEAD/DEAH box helicase [Priestia flexa]MCM3068200.1 DEAD/DEAH box helicase [Priestia flexa]MEC0666006.1 DEAD/DEAH box helicase [Priestia flexa]MED3824055.1 DEAD/DEAH box helicase [Priestia flexa]QCS51316.1 DEAD/DEAH box helicase [Priestia flexa]